MNTNNHGPKQLNLRMEAPVPDNEIHSETLLKSRIDESFIQYASYVIRDRAIPKLGDGLKPVQRRIMYSLHRNDDGKLIKVQNIAGHCMQFHPHGDVSIVDALVVLANKRYLIERQGNFGNPFTGDRPAAGRYIECRLTDLARKQLFNDELTEFVPTYDGRTREPVCLPSKIPLLLMLGADGIAVGLSCRILPHNFIELLQAQIEILRKKPFQVAPDFIQGCLMDASEYNDGRGAVRLRARIRKKDHNTLTIQEVPFGVTTESLINSIESASKKGRIKLRSINDFTSEKVEIEIKLGVGSDSQTAIQALYAFTDCEVSVSSRIIVIVNNRPVEMTVSEALKANTQSLVKTLEAELRLKHAKLTEELQTKTLVRIFVENRIYKRIEQCKTQETVKKAVVSGFAPFRDQLVRDLSEKDLEMLLGTHIRRISLFDIDQHRQDMERIRREMEGIEKNLRALTRYAIGFLKDLIEDYASQYPRLTKIEPFDSVVAKDVVARALKMSYDRKKGYLGVQVNGDEFPIKCSAFDKIVVVTDDGVFRVISVPDKLYMGGGVVYCVLYHRDDLVSMVYRIKDLNYFKRFVFGGVVLNKKYRCAPEKSKVLLLRAGAPETIFIKYRPALGQKVHQQTLSPADVAVKTAKARGNQISIKKISNVGAKRPRNWDEDLKTTRVVFG